MDVGTSRLGPRWQKQQMEGPGVPRAMLGGWGWVDPHPHSEDPSLVTRAGGGISPELLECRRLPDRAQCRACVPWDGDRAGLAPSALLSTSHGIFILSPAATLKCKQDELHRKALQTLER